MVGVPAAGGPDLFRTRYERMLGALYQRELFGIRLGLGTTRRLVARLGHPERAFPALLVAGTNGKGSTCAVASSILREAGYRTGLFTSPHLLDYRERIRVDGEAISREEMLALAEPLLPLIERTGATYFEAATALGFLHFARRGVDVAVVEVGLGGRLDATNVLPRPLGVVTDVDLDHQDRLGKTLAAIAAEKAGIIRRAGEVVSGCRRPAAARVIRRTARRRAAQLMELDRCARYEVRECGPWGLRMALRTAAADYGEIHLPLIGSHQARNAAAAVVALERWSAGRGGLPRQAVIDGLRRVSWPGRMQVVMGDPVVVLDVAHNPQGARALAAAWTETFGSKRPVLLFGCLAGKDSGGMLRALAPLARSVVLAEPSGGRRPAPLEALARKARQQGGGTEGRIAPSVAAGLEMARRAAGPRGMVLAAGSCYLVAEAMIACGLGVPERI